MSVLPTSILLGGPVIQSSPGGGSSPTPLSESQAAPAPATTGNQEGSPQGGFTEPTSSSPPVAAATSSAAALASDSEGGGGGGGGTDAGVIAGVAVGAAVGAAILTFLITFLLLRKKNKKSRRHREHRSGSGGLSTYTEKALPKDPSPGADAVVAAAAWQRHLPQSADDKTIRSSVKTLFDQVEVHVENFYRDAAVRMTEDLQAELLHVDSPHLPESVVALLQRVRSQTALIKHCLLSYIVASITTDDDSVPSLLPADYAALPHLARATGEKKPGFDQALSQWRVLSAYLRPSPRNDQTYLSQRDSHIAAAATAFTNAFSPWASNAYDDTVRRQNVAEIFKSAADVGILIFSQPSSFTYQWNTSSSSSAAHDRDRGTAAGRVIVITPAFLKVADENANVLDRPQVMIQMATQSI